MSGAGDRVGLLGAGSAGAVGDGLGIGQQLRHPGRPALARLLDDRVQLAQQVRPAQRMGDG